MPYPAPINPGLIALYMQMVFYQGKVYFYLDMRKELKTYYTFVW